MDQLKNYSYTPITSILSFLLLIASLLLTPFNANADEPRCFGSTSGVEAYCEYYGTVKYLEVSGAYSTSLWFDTSIDSAKIAEIGFTDIRAGQSGLTVVLGSDDLDFAKAFYAAALSAKIAGKKVRINMRGTYNGFLKADRIRIED